MPSLRDPDSRLSVLVAASLLPIATVQALWIVARFRPRAVLTAGGLVSLPVALAASLARVPIVLWDGDAIPGRVNRLLARFARCVAATFAEEAEHFPRDKVVVTGNPVRRELLGRSAQEARAALGLPQDARVLLVSGGSQGSERMNAVLLQTLGRILRRAHVVHLAGEAHLARCEAARDKLLEELRDRYRPYAFLREEMGAALAAADLIVGRAGSSTIAEALAVGRPLVLVPFEASASGHQLANARSAVGAGAAVLVREGDLDAERFAAVVVGLLDDGERLARMRTAAARAGKPEAAVTIASRVLAFAEPPKARRPMARPKR